METYVFLMVRRMSNDSNAREKLQCARYYASFLFVPIQLALFRWPNFYTTDGRFLGYIKPT